MFFRYSTTTTIPFRWSTVRFICIAPSISIANDIKTMSWPSGYFWQRLCPLFAFFFRGTLKLATVVACYHWPKMSTTMYALQIQTHKRVYYAHSLFLGFFLCGWCFLPGQDVYSLDFPVRSVFRWSQGLNVKGSATFPGVCLPQIVYKYWNYM